MTQSPALTRPDDATTATRPRSRVFSILVGLSTLVVLLQGLWAGFFIQEGQDYKDSWVEVHARGADLAIALALAATVVALVKLRSRRDLVAGSIAFTVLLVLEAYLGGLIGDHSALTGIHFPLAMLLMGLAVWLPLRARR